MAVSRVVASLHDVTTKRVTLEGFYDNVKDLADWEKAEMEVVDDVAEAKYLGISKMTGEVGYTTYERKTVRPTLELTGIYGGFMGEGIKSSYRCHIHTSCLSFSPHASSSCMHFDSTDTYM